jgi:hypothetical protein
MGRGLLTRDLVMPLSAIRSLVAEGSPVHKALYSVASPYGEGYEEWSRLWDALWDELPAGNAKSNLRDWGSLATQSERLALVDAALAKASGLGLAGGPV